jgi:hypothetical protein
MPFPFLPAGAVLAAAVLIGALTAFGLILRAMDRAIVGLRDTVLSGLVSGFRTWSSSHSDRPIRSSPRASTGSPWGVPHKASPSTAAPAGLFTASSTDTFPPAELVDLGSRPTRPRSTSRN